MNKVQPELNGSNAKSDCAYAQIKDPRGRKSNGRFEMVYEMISARGGATVPEIIAATGWAPHTVRARISGIGKAHKVQVERVRIFGITTYRAAKET